MRKMLIATIWIAGVLMFSLAAVVASQHAHPCGAHPPSSSVQATS